MKRTLKNKGQMLKLTTLGFTLIELLAVIVILAVIALIATPLIMGVISDAKKGAFRSSAYGILSAGEKYIALQLLKQPGPYLGEIIDALDHDKLQYQGEEPKGGDLITTPSGKIALMLYNDSFCAIKNIDESEIKIEAYDKDRCSMKNLGTYLTLQNQKEDGIFKDDYGNLRYRGSNSEVKNYITYNNDTFRIIGVFDGRVKIIRDAHIGGYAWNTGSNWETSDINKYLNGTWYNNLSSEAKAQTEPSIYYLGGVTVQSTMTPKIVYQKEHETFVMEGNPTQYTGVVALMTVSDYGYAARSSCSMFYGDYASDPNCSTEGNWLFIPNIHQWTQTVTTSTAVNRVSSNGSVGYYGTNIGLPTRPTLYLKSSVERVSGDGTKAKPYIVK